MSTVAIVLAADSGSGFRVPKYITPVHGKPMLQTVVNNAVDWPVDDVVVVLGSDAEAILDVVDFHDSTVVVDPEWEEGSASSIRAALDLISRDGSVTTSVIARGDQTGVESAVVQVLVDAAAAAPVDAVVPKYRYSRGWPVVVARSLWEHLLGSEGSVDLHDVIASHATSTEEVWFDHLSPKTIEAPDDLPSSGR